MDVIVHGGAGDAPEDPEDRQETLEGAAVVAAEQDDPLDAVEVAVRVLEADGAFNAGTGSVVQSDGVIRTEAGLMTSDRTVGAAAGMPGVEHAVTVARLVHEETPHVQVAGVHAVDLAADFDVPVEVDLWTDRTRARWGSETPPPQPMHVQAAWVRDRWRGADAETAPDDGSPEYDRAPDDGPPEYDRAPDDGPSEYDPSASERSDPGNTVGAVAREGDRIAAATSTGGRWGALAGRVGDVPQVGAGFFATPAAGASATGAGEDIARTALARTAVEAVAEGADAESAAAAALSSFEDVAGSGAGVIVADADGGLGSAFDTEAMQTATERR